MLRYFNAHKYILLTRLLTKPLPDFARGGISLSLLLEFTAAVDPLLEQLMKAGGRKAAQSAGQDNVRRDHSPLVDPQRHDHADDHHHGGNDPIADLG